MNEIQLAAHDLLVDLAPVFHAHEMMKALKPQWEFKEHTSNWIESHVMSVEGNEAEKIAANACKSIADEVRGVLIDSIGNMLNP